EQDENALPEEKYLSESLIERNEWTDEPDAAGGEKDESYAGQAAGAEQKVENKSHGAEEAPVKTGKQKLFKKKDRPKRPKRPENPKKPKNNTKLTALKKKTKITTKHTLMPT